MPPASALFLVVASLTCCFSLPVIIDTDIGTDFDDSVALAFAIQSTDLDVRLVVSATGDTRARARVVTKYLTAYGRDDIPIGIGVPDNKTAAGSLYGWAADFNLSNYKGTVYSDGVDKMASIIKESNQTVLIIAIAPATNFPSLLQRFPEVANRIEVKAMSGSINHGYANSSHPAAEYNVQHCPTCSSVMYKASWNLTITPLDTCGVVTLSGSSWDCLLNGTNGVAPVLMESWIYWCLHSGSGSCSVTPGSHTDVFYDPVAVLLCLPLSLDLMDFKVLKIRITEDGHTVIDNNEGSSTLVAISWKGNGLDDFDQFLATTIAIDSSS
ncbi:uncharacterized protein LOC134193628 [Corticium candelabrum]|uniref:uncharacterized protein LOC134193628 n=1 Tax=Corticium candelabrum TaxID=121492 RepID=UPI002E271516|nr:uncharacterized protein LOC134193628 [Corticium candelabrum]